MSQLGMPWVVVNMGCEMIYILEQRLKAQNISAVKCHKVLHDVACTMFDRCFIKEKFMDKLFDLMVMAAKYQATCITRLEELMQVVLRHLSNVRAILLGTAAAAAAGADGLTALDLISETEEATIRMYAHLSQGQLALLKQALIRFFQDKRVKVSLFLVEGIQAPYGKLVLPGCVKEGVGRVKTFGPDGSVLAQQMLELDCLKVNPNEFFCHPLPLGDNLYNKNRPGVVPPPRAHDQSSLTTAPAAATTATSDANSGSTTCSSATQRKYADEFKGSLAARQELDLLTSLIHNSSKASKPADNFKLNLFGDDGDDGEGLAAAQPASKDPRFETAPVTAPGVKELCFGVGGKNDAYRIAAGLGDVLGGMTMDEGGAEDGEPNLLDLMDSAA